MTTVPKTTRTDSDPFENAAYFLRGSDMTASEFVNAVRNKASSVDFPTKSCLSPTVVSEYSETAQLSSKDEHHLATCVYCSALVRSLVPDSVNVQMFREQVRQAPSHQESHTQMPLLDRVMSSIHSAIGRGSLVVWGTAVASILAVAVLFTAKQPGALPLTSPVPAPKVAVVSPSHVQQAELVLSDEHHAANSMVLHVGLERQPEAGSYSLDQASYSKVAAGVATLSLAKHGPGLKTSHEAELKEQYTNALAELSTRLIESQHSDTGNMDSEVAFWISNQSDKQGDCDAFAKQLTGKDLKITKGDRPSDCTVQYRSAMLRVDPKESVNETIRYVYFLKSNSGDVAALDKAANNVHLRLLDGNVLALGEPNSPAKAGVIR